MNGGGHQWRNHGWERVDECPMHVGPRLVSGCAEIPRVSGVGYEWVGVCGVNRLHNEPVLFHQCLMFSTAWTMRLSAEDCVSISGLASGGYRGSASILRWGILPRRASVLTLTPPTSNLWLCYWEPSNVSVSYHHLSLLHWRPVRQRIEYKQCLLDCPPT